MTYTNNGRPPRTLLEQLIRQRNETLEEFTESADTYAREHGEPGTLSLRHLQRLITGKRSDGRPLGTLRPATARLLERMLGESIDMLLGQPRNGQEQDSERDELRARIATARRVDQSLIEQLHNQLHATRRLDRELGAVVAHDEVMTKFDQVQQLLSYSLMPTARQQLAALLSELGTLAGWQALDLGKIPEAWQYYQAARTAAAASESRIYEAHAAAEQAYVLVDVGEYQAAADLASAARNRVGSNAPALLLAWLHAARGETLATLHRRDESLQAFDAATERLSTAPGDQDGPYVVLDTVHLARWRGHALTRIGDSAALDVLTNAWARLDSSFTRAEATLEVDIASTYALQGESAAADAHLRRAKAIADQICSERQRRRARLLAKRLPGALSR